MIQRLGAALAAALIATSAPSRGASSSMRSAPAAEEPRLLVIGSPIERNLKAGESQTYRLELHAGDFLHITIAQQGIDVVATLKRPDGREFISVNACEDDFRAETVVAIADVDGSHTLVVRPASSTTVQGRYTIRFDDRRAALPTDNVRVEAERAFERGFGLRVMNLPKSYPQALHELDAALTGYRQRGDRHGEVKALLELSKVQDGLRRGSGLTSAQLAEQIARELDDPPSTAAALYSEGIAYDGNPRDPAAALRAFEQSIAISRTIGNRKLQWKTLNSEGVIYGRNGDSERAVAYFEQASPFARAVNDAVGESTILLNLGTAYQELGELEKALDAHRRALMGIRESGNPERQALALNNIGNDERDLGRDRQALEHHLEALAISRETGGKENEARLLNNIGQTYFALRDYTRALDQERQSLDIRRQIGDVAGQAASLDSMGRAWHKLGDREKALEAFDESLTIARRIREQHRELVTLGHLAELQRDYGDIATALAHVATAVDLEESMRARITSPELRTAFAADQLNKYELFIDLLQSEQLAGLSEEGNRKAFNVSERARARVLLESLVDARVDLREGIDPALLQRERALQLQLNEAATLLSRALAGNSRSDQVDAAAKKVDQLTDDYQRLQAEIRQRSPRYAAVTQPQPLGIDEIQQAVLDDDSVLLEFALGERRSWLWAVTPHAIRSVELPPRQSIELAARSLYEQFTERQKHRGEDADAYVRRIRSADARFTREAAAMSQTLLGPIAEPLSGEWRGKRLAIVAAGALQYLPFAALPVPVSDPTTPHRQTDAPLLIAQHEIVNIPSASVLAELRRETAHREPGRRTIAILADPVFEATDPRVHATFVKRPSESSSSSAVRIGGRPAELTRLPFSREEASAIAALVAADERFEATDFKAERALAMGGTLARYRVVHFATHAVIDNQRPSLTSLVLSLVDERGTPQDGYLRLHDIYNLRLNADLVVLSACQTALGKEIKGEGLIGLTRAFMYAGTPRVVASLWEVGDLATAELMKAFYRRLFQQGQRPAAALRAAQLEMAGNPRWASPFYWAGFVLDGDWK